MTILLLLKTCGMFCQGLHDVQGGASGAVYSGINTTVIGPQSMYGNIANIVNLNQWSMDLGYTRLYGVNGLDELNIGAVLPSKVGHFGMQVQHFGIEDLSETTMGVAYGRKIFDKLNIGVAFSMHSINTRSFGQRYTVSGTIGLSYIINKWLSLGVYGENPAPIKLNEVDYLPSRFAVGLVYKPSTQVDIHIETYKSSRLSPELRIAVLYRVHKYLGLYVGSNIVRDSMSAGMHLDYRRLRFIAGYTYNNHLGHTPSLSLQYNPRY